MARRVDSQSTRIRSTRFAAVTAALAALTLTLAGCGSSADGTYYAEDVNGGSSTHLSQLVVDGDTLTHHEYSCDGVYEKPSVTSTGEFNEDRTQVTWLVAGDDDRNARVGTEPVTISDNSISIGEDVYALEDSDAGKALMDGFQAEQCD